METKQPIPQAAEGWRERSPEEWADLERRLKAAEEYAEAEERNSVLEWRGRQAAENKVMEMEAEQIKQAITLLSTFAEKHAALISERFKLVNIITEQEGKIRDLERRLSKIN